MQISSSSDGVLRPHNSEQWFSNFTMHLNPLEDLLTHIAVSHPQIFWCSRSQAGPKHLHFWQVSWWCWTGWTGTKNHCLKPVPCVRNFNVSGQWRLLCLQGHPVPARTKGNFPGGAVVSCLCPGVCLYGTYIQKQYIDEIMTKWSPRIVQKWESQIITCFNPERGPHLSGVCICFTASAQQVTVARLQFQS